VGESNASAGYWSTNSEFSGKQEGLGGNERGASGENAMNKVNLAEKLSHITEYWKPRILAELNGQELKLVKIHGTFVWHHHENEDELLLCLSGRLRIQFRDGSVEIGAGEFSIVPKGIEHRTSADEKTTFLFSSQLAPAIREM
jgi:mannose-6-phosphate isomerase-like protein (cupin superfamily)